MVRAMLLAVVTVCCAVSVAVAQTATGTKRMCAANAAYTPGASYTGVYGFNPFQKLVNAGASTAASSSAICTIPTTTSAASGPRTFTTCQVRRATMTQHQPGGVSSYCGEVPASVRVL